MFTQDYRDHRCIVKLSFMFYSLKRKLNKNWWIYERESESRSVVSNSLCPLIVHGILPARILEWEAFPFSRGSSQPRDWTQVSHNAGGFFTSWATREVQEILEWVAYPFSSGSSGPRNQAGVSCIAGKFFTSWVTREALQEVGDISINDSLESKLICCWKN